MIAGGWTVHTSVCSGVAKADAEKEALFERAVKNLDGVKLKPVLYCGSQVVAGMNHTFIAESSPVVPNPITSLVKVVIYEPLPDHGDPVIVMIDRII